MVEVMQLLLYSTNNCSIRSVSHAGTVRLAAAGRCDGCAHILVLVEHYNPLQRGYLYGVDV